MGVNGLSKFTMLEKGTWKTGGAWFFLNWTRTTLLFLNVFHDKPSNAMRGLNSVNLGSAESFVASSGSIKLLMSCQFLLHSRHVWPENLFSTTNKTSVPSYKS